MKSNILSITTLKEYSDAQKKAFIKNNRCSDCKYFKKRFMVCGWVSSPSFIGQLSECPKFK